MMALDVEDVIAGLDPERRRRIEERAAELIAEEMTLRELRRARELTQASVARELGISQDAISRLEQRSDVLLSTLRRTVEAMGGSLSLIARFPDRPPVELAGIAETTIRTVGVKVPSGRGSPPPDTILRASRGEPLAQFR
jgi:transcriptional regulator with XRE-family HTH domain